MSKNMDKRSIRSRLAIEKSLIELLQKYDLEDITVTRLLDKAGYSRTAFYNNYLDIYDCLETILDAQAELLYQSMQPTMADSISHAGPRQIERGNLHELVFRTPYETVYANKDVYMLLCNRLPQSWLNTFINKVVDRMTVSNEYIARGYEADFINPELWIWSHFWETMGRVVYWIKQGMIYSPEYMGRQQYLKRLEVSYVMPKDHETL